MKLSKVLLAGFFFHKYKVVISLSVTRSYFENRIFEIEKVQKIKFEYTIS